MEEKEKTMTIFINKLTILEVDVDYNIFNWIIYFNLY